MSDGALQGDVLSRDELDALLATLADEREADDADARSGVLSRRESAQPGGRPRGGLYPALARAVAQWATDQGRRLSSIYQTTIEFHLSQWEETTLGELAETIPPADMMAVLELGPPRGIGFLWLGRPLLFSLMTLSFGARTPKAAAPVARAYTRIERRFYRHQAESLVGSIDEAWADLVPARTRVLTVDGLERLYEDAHDRVLLATFEVRGLAEFGRLRLALPPAAFAPLAGNAGRVVPANQEEVTDAVLDTVVSLRVEAGGIDLSLSGLAALKVGEVLPIEAEREGSLIVHVEGRPKFRGQRGSVGGRLAIQITERIER